MKTGLRVQPWFVCGLLATAFAASRADDPPNALKERLKRLNSQFQESLGWYRVSASRDSEAIKPRSVLRRTNATRGQEEAIRKDGRGVWQYAFGRATGAGLEAKFGSAIVWTAPRTSGSSDPRRPHVILGRPLVR